MRADGASKFSALLLESCKWRNSAQEIMPRCHRLGEQRLYFRLGLGAQSRHRLLVRHLLVFALQRRGEVREGVRGIVGAGEGESEPVRVD